jgi:hypothetical protein
MPRVQDLSAWRNFPKPRPLPPPDRRPTPAVFRDIPVSLIAQWGCVSLKHAKLLKSGARMPSPQLVRLICLYRDERVLAGPFSRFIVRGNKLVTPEGLEFTEAELRGYISMIQWARSIAGSVGRDDEYYERLEACRESA